MKFLRVYLILSLCPVMLFAQRKSIEDLFLKRGSFAVDGGLSLPVMDYGLSKLTTASGYALPGYQLRLNLSYEYTRFFGIKLTYFYNRNSFNDEGLKRDFEPIHTQIFPGTTLSNIRTASYHLDGLMLGLVLPFRTSDATYSFKIMGGILGSVYPQQEFEMLVQPAQRLLVLRVEEATANDLAYLTGVDMKFRITHDLLLSTYIDFLYSEQTYTNLRITNTQNGLSVPWSNEYTQYYHVIGAGIGLAWQFE